MIWRRAPPDIIGQTIGSAIAGELGSLSQRAEVKSIANSDAVPEDMRGSAETTDFVRTAKLAGVSRDDIVAMLQAEHELASIDLERSEIIPAGMNKGEKARANAEWKANALRNIARVLRMDSTSATAKLVLLSFATGKGPRVFRFGPNSEGTSELFSSKPGYYYERNTIEAMRYMAFDSRSYGTGDLRDGYQVTGYTWKDFTPFDAAIGAMDGVQLGDVTGTFSSGINAVVRDDMVNFHAENLMTLTSYAAGNLIQSQQNVIVDPKTGPLSPVKMIFDWTRPIPQYLKPKQ